MKNWVAALVMVLVALAGVGQDTIEYYFFGTSGPENALETYTLGDGYAVFGSTGLVGNGQSDMYIVKLDSAFNPVQFKPVGGSTVEKLVDVTKSVISEEFFTLSTYYDGFGSQSYNVRLDRLNGSFQVLNSSYLESLEQLIAIKCHSDSTKVYSLSQELSPSLSSKYRLNINAALDLSLIGGFDLIFNENIELFDFLKVANKYFFIGINQQVDSNNRDAVIISYTESGEFISSWYYGGMRNDSVSTIQTSSDGNLIVVGSSRSFRETDDYDAWIFETTVTGELLWQRHYGHDLSSTQQFNDYGVDAIKLSQDTLLLGVTTYTFGEGQGDYQLFLLSDSNEYIDANSFGFSEIDELAGVSLGHNGEFILTGTSMSTGTSGQEDFLLAVAKNLVSNSYEVVKSFEDTISTSNLVSVEYINQPSDLAQCVYDASGLAVKFERLGEYELILFDQLGKVVTRKRVTKNQGSVSFNSEISPVAFLVIYDEESNARQVIKLARIGF